MLYVFVDIKIDLIHFIDTVKHNFEPGSTIALVSTIQFVAALQVLFLFSPKFVFMWNHQAKPSAQVYVIYCESVQSAP